MKNKKLFNGFNSEEMESVFDKFNEYGLDLLYPSILALDLKKVKNADVLYNVYNDIYAEKVLEEKDQYKTLYSDRIGLKNALSSLDDYELRFIKELLKTNPWEVFSENPYINYNKEEFEELTKDDDPYKDICSFVDEEFSIRFINLPSGFSTRFNNSMSLKNKIGSIKPYSI